MTPPVCAAGGHFVRLPPLAPAAPFVPVGTMAAVLVLGGVADPMAAIETLLAAGFPAADVQAGLVEALALAAEWGPE